MNHSGQSSPRLSGTHVPKAIAYPALGPSNDSLLGAEIRSFPETGTPAHRGASLEKQGRLAMWVSRARQGGAAGEDRLLESLVHLSEQQRPGRTGHSRRVADLSSQLALAGGQSRREADLIGTATRFLDVGMATVPLELLSKQGGLSRAERAEIVRHAEVGAALLSRMDRPWTRTAVRIALHHHEWWDGSGYPKGLRSLSIPLEARIAAICDVFAALTGGSARRERLTVEAALEAISRGAGTQFDPTQVTLFMATVRQRHNAAARWPG